MTTEEMKAAIDAAMENLKKGIVTPEQLKAIADKVENFKDSTPELETVKKNFDELKTQYKALEDAAKNQSAEIKSLKQSNGRVKSVKDLLSVDTIKKAFDNVKNGVSHVFEVKAVENITTGNIAPTTAGGAVLSLLGADGELYYINRSNGDSILELVTMGTADKASIPWVDEVEGKGTVTSTAEGVAKNQIDIKFKENVSNAIKETGYVKVTTEALSDVGYMATAINRVLTTKLGNAMEADVLADIISKATAYSLTDFNAKVENANQMDAINAAIAQASLSGFAPTSILLNPIDVIALRFIKDKNGMPVVTFFNDGRLPMLNNGLMIKSNKLVTKGDFVLGDFKLYNVLMYKQNVSVGLDADDFTKNNVTILAEARYHKIVSSNEKTSFVKGTFTTIIAAIDKPAA